MDSDFTSRTAILAVMLVALAVTAPLAMAAAPSLDNETTNTTTTTDVSDGSVLTEFNAAGNNYTWIEFTADSSNSSVKIQDPDSGATYYSNTSVMATDSTNGHYAVNFSHAELSDVPVEANQNTTVQVVITNNTAVSNPDTTKFNITLAADGSRTVVNVDESVTSDANAFSSETLGLFGMQSLAGIIGDHDTTEVSQDNLAVSGKNTTMTVYLSNQTAQDSFSSAADGTEDGSMDVDLKATMDAGGEEVVVPHFVNSAPDSVPDGQTYAVYHTDSNKVVYHLGDDFEGKSEIDSLTVKSGKPLSWMQTLSFSRDFGMGLIMQKAIPGVGPLF